MSKNKSKIMDVITGEMLGVRPDVYAQRVEEYGDEKTLLTQYVGRNTKAMLREGLTVDQIRTKVGAPKNLSTISSETLASIKSRFSGTTPSKKRSTIQKKTEVEEEVDDEVDSDVEEFLNVGKTALATT